MTIDTDLENGAGSRFDDVRDQAERIREDAAALASSASRLLEGRIREKPLQTLLVGVAIGWLAGKFL